MEHLDPFQSSSIQWAAYDRKNKTLYVQFTGNEDKYEYLEVPIKKWKALQAAESKGQYINSHIKPFHEVEKY